jgi:hypothetical protein
MPFALVVVGLIMIVVGVRGTQKEFGAQLASDFTGDGNFIWWLASLGAVGAVGYVPQLRQFSIAFMTLIIIAMLIAQQKAGGASGGFFEKLSQALQQGPVAPMAGETNYNAVPDSVSSGANNLGRNVGTIANSNNAGENFDRVADVAKWFF